MRKLVGFFVVAVGLSSFGYLLPMQNLAKQTPGVASTPADPAAPSRIPADFWRLSAAANKPPLGRGWSERQQLESDLSWYTAKQAELKEAANSFYQVIPNNPHPNYPKAAMGWAIEKAKFRAIAEDAYIKYQVSIDWCKDQLAALPS